MLVSSLSMVEVSTNVYTWTPATDELDVVNPAAVGPGSIPDATIAGFNAVASANIATNESAPAIEVSWTAPSDPTIATVAIDYKRPSAGTWLTQSFDAKLGAGQITGLASGSWQVRARPITTPLRPGTASGIVTVTLVGIQALTAATGPGGAPILNSQVTGFANQAIDTEFNYYDRTWGALFASAGTWTVSKFVALGATQVLRRAATAPPAGAQFNIGQSLAASLPVQEGQRLEVSAIISPTNCTPASNLQVSWFNVSGSFVGATPVANSNGDSVVGGFVTVPFGIGAALASLTAVFIVNVGGVYTEGRFARPFLRIASTEQSVLTAYTPGPVERNADQTGSNTAASIIGQGTGATASNLTGLNPGEGAKLGGIEPGADVTSGKTAAAIIGQGALAIKNTITLGDVLNGTQPNNSTLAETTTGSVTLTTSWSTISDTTVTSWKGGLADVRWMFTGFISASQTWIALPSPFPTPKLILARLLVDNVATGPEIVAGILGITFKGNTDWAEELSAPIQAVFQEAVAAGSNRNFKVQLRLNRDTLGFGSSRPGRMSVRECML
jgi:hypothetical protein